MRRVALYGVTIVVGLFVSAEYAEWPVNIWCLGLFGWLFFKGEKRERIEMLTVLAFATPMELFFSEVWLIYEYQRGLMPLFVPVGHYFLFDLGRIIATKMKENLAMLLLTPFIPLVAYGIYSGGDGRATAAGYFRKARGHQGRSSQLERQRVDVFGPERSRGDAEGCGAARYDASVLRDTCLFCSNGRGVALAFPA